MNFEYVFVERKWNERTHQVPPLDAWRLAPRCVAQRCHAGTALLCGLSGGGMRYTPVCRFDFEGRLTFLYKPKKKGEWLLFRAVSQAILVAVEAAEVRRP